MTISRRLAAHRQALASAALEEPETMETPPEEQIEDQPEGQNKDDEFMTEEEHKAAVAEAEAAALAKGFAAANARAATVMASEHYKGREPLAAKLLEKDALSADDIVGMLEAASPAAPANAAEADDDRARAEMRANLAAEQPEPTGTAGENALETEASDTSLVDSMKARFSAAK